MHRLSTRLRGRIDRKFGSEIRFLKNWVDSPKSVGAIWPTSAVTARRMAEVINVDSNLPVLELGPGTGAITEAIINRGVAPAKIYSVEYSEHFIIDLKRRFPGVNFINADAFDVAGFISQAGVGQFDSIVSGLPLLNFPARMRIELIENLLDHLPTGRPIVQFCYGPRSPVPEGKGNYTVRHYDWIARNVPPARLWTYFRES